MNMHTPEQLRQHNEHLARQERLIHGKTKNPVYEAEIKLLRQCNSQALAKNIETSKALQAAQAMISGLEEKLAEAEATILHQSDLLCDAAGVSQEQPKRHVRSIAADVLTEFPGITWDDIIGERRSRKFIVPRQICIAAVRDERPDLSLRLIGRIFGGRDHTTVLHHVRKIKAILEGAGI